MKIDRKTFFVSLLSYSLGFVIAVYFFGNKFEQVVSVEEYKNFFCPDKTCVSPLGIYKSDRGSEPVEFKVSKIQDLVCFFHNSDPVAPANCFRSSGELVLSYRPEPPSEFSILHGKRQSVLSVIDTNDDGNLDLLMYDKKVDGQPSKTVRDVNIDGSLECFSLDNSWENC